MEICAKKRCNNTDKSKMETQLGGGHEDDTGTKTCWVTELSNENGNFKTKIENLAVRHKGVG